MKVYTVTITQVQLEDRFERVLIFSSLEKVYEWKKSYRTPNNSFGLYGEELAIIREIEIDTNTLTGTSESFCIEVGDTPIGDDNIRFPLKKINID